MSKPGTGIATAKYLASEVFYVSERTAKRRLQAIRKKLGLPKYSRLTFEQVKSYSNE